jgi:hypothetical protein
LAAFAVGDDKGESDAPPNVESSTFGGLQYWADELIFHEYRIQRSASTGHYRLLDGRDHRLAWGTFDQCRTQLEALRRQQKLPPLPKRVVLTLHGIARSRHSMNALADCLRSHSSTPVYQVGYPSTREAVPELARSFDRLVRNLDGVEEIDIVAFSMGNLVVRHWLGDIAVETDATVRRPKLRRYVMLGPPNNGAARANLWADSTVGSHLFRFVMGDAGQQLGPRYAEIKERLAVPDCEFAILAGGKGDGAGWHADIPGDDDGTVGVDETKIPGATDFAVVPVRHTWLTSDPTATAMTCSFLEHGYFTTAEKRNPLPR